MPDDLTSVATELHWLTIAEAARLFEKRQLSPVELTDALLARIDALDPQINAFLLPTPDKARAQARTAEREIMAGNYRGPLHGVPFGLKDIYCTAGIRTTSHSRICADYVPTEDATTVTRLYQAGGILIGKLATHEFAHGGPSFDLAWPPASGCSQDCHGAASVRPSGLKRSLRTSIPSARRNRATSRGSPSSDSSSRSRFLSGPIASASARNNPRNRFPP